MKKTLIALALVTLVACGGAGSTTTTAAAVTTTAAAVTTTAAPATTTTAAEATTTTAAAAGLTLTVSETDLGSIVVDSGGNTLYAFLPDAQGDPTCKGDCAANWPPLTEAVTAGEGLDATLLGTAAGQATYNGWPLYYFASDASPGDINGQGVGDVWFVIDAAGSPVQG
jgi:predicted lipoprotein with Yx(FWY)xxD motif